MDLDLSVASLWDQGLLWANALVGALTQVDPQYLLLAMGVLIWLQLGRIVRALKGSGGLPKDLPLRVDNLQAKVQSMSNEIADFQVYAAARRRPLSTEDSLATYRDKAV
ncbi:MAG: hypothetical protein OEM59_14790 [Rhodospirillales bacterium]|nr:hypothetical protein [Rhodospirillales bacterium]